MNSKYNQLKPSLHLHLYRQNLLFHLQLLNALYAFLYALFKQRLNEMLHVVVSVLQMVLLLCVYCCRSSARSGRWEV